MRSLMRFKKEDPGVFSKQRVLCYEEAEITRNNWMIREAIPTPFSERYWRCKICISPEKPT